VGQDRSCEFTLSAEAAHRAVADRGTTRRDTGRKATTPGDVSGGPRQAIAPEFRLRPVRRNNFPRRGCHRPRPARLLLPAVWRIQPTHVTVMAVPHRCGATRRAPSSQSSQSARLANFLTIAELLPGHGAQLERVTGGPARRVQLDGRSVGQFLRTHRQVCPGASFSSPVDLDEGNDRDDHD
jgi:hypothetical protein